jgi:hypothetical protein
MECPGKIITFYWLTCHIICYSVKELSVGWLGPIETVRVTPGSRTGTGLQSRQTGGLIAATKPVRVINNHCFLIIAGHLGSLESLLFTKFVFGTAFAFRQNSVLYPMKNKTCEI